MCGEWVAVPAQPAATWLEQFMGGDLDLDAIFPGFCEAEQQDFVNDCLLEGCLDIEQLEKLTLGLIGQVAGRPWWVALRMIMVAEQRWSILGADLIVRKIDAATVSLSAWLDALWSSIFSHLPQDKWLEMSLIIETPPPSEAPEDPMEAMEISVDAFASMMRG